MPLLPRFTLLGQGRVRIDLNASVGLEFDLSELRSPRYLFDDDEMPDNYEGLRAALLWCKRRGVTIRQVMTTPALRTAYLAATYTPMDVSA